MKKVGVRLMFWAAGGACRLAERIGEGWTISAPLSLESLHHLLGDLASGREPAFARDSVVTGLVGADDITELAGPLKAKLEERRGESSSQVRLLCWVDNEPQQYRLAEPCESGGWKISAPLAGDAIPRAMRSLARGRRPKFAAVGVVADVVGCDDITDGAADTIADN
jgi:hypothetical protein